MLDYLRTDYAVERAVPEGQRERRPAQQRNAVAAEEAQFAEVHVHPDGIVEALDDDAGTAADIQNAICPARPRGGNPMTHALPIALNRDDAVKRAVVIVGRRDGITQRP